MNSEEKMSSLGFVGLGVMGQHMATNLVRKADLPVYVYDLNTEAIASVVAQGASACNSLNDLGRTCDVVFLSLPNSRAVEEVCLGDDGICSGSCPPKIVVDMGTTDVAMTLNIGARLWEKGVVYVDAPVARMPEAARDGTLLILVGSKTPVFEELFPLFGIMGSDVLHCGDLGAGQTVKIINNFVLIANVRALTEASLMGERAGVPVDLLFKAMHLGSATSKALEVAGMRGLVPREFPLGRFSAAYALKDMTLAKQLAQAGGISADILDITMASLQDAVQHGDADKYYPVMLRAVERASGLR